MKKTDYIDYNPNIITKEQLLEEAKKRYPIGTKFKSLLSGTIYTVSDYSGTISNGWLSKDYVIVYVEGVVSRGEYLYKSGDWAEIVEDKEVFPKYVEYIDTKYKGIIVKVEDWCCGSYCKVVFYNGNKEQPFKHLVKTSTKEAYDLQNLKQQPLTPEECYNTEIEVGDEIEIIQPCPSSYNKKGFKGIVTEIRDVSLTTFGNCIGYKINGWYEHISGLKIIKKASQITKQVNFNSPKVTNEITVPRINTISRDKLIHINIETNTKSITIPKLETKSPEIKNIKIQSFSLTI